MTMEKYATDPAGRSEPACEEGYDAKPGTSTPQDQATCRVCAHYDSQRNQRTALCPWQGRDRPLRIGR